jgi:para-nitrobenzyl esterase
VKDNIAEFGGDPNTVMIFGQSGGGRKVGTLLAMPSAKGLFHRAVIESGPTIKLVDKDQAIWVADQVLKKAGLNKTQVRELQKLPLEQLMGVYYGLMRSINVDMFTAGFSPTMDGKVVPQHPFHPAASAVSANVPVIVGCNRTEDTSFERDQAVFSLDKAGMREHVRDTIGSEAEPAYREALVDSLIDVYSMANPGASPSEIYFLIASDQKFVAPSMKIAERRADLGKGPVYLYYFRWETPVNGGKLKTPHGMEVPMVFDNVKISARTTGGGPDAMALADKVSDAWIAFAKTGNPNTPKLPNWPAFNSTDWPTMVFNSESKVEKDPIREQRMAMFTATGLS